MVTTFSMPFNFGNGFTEVILHYRASNVLISAPGLHCRRRQSANGYYRPVYPDSSISVQHQGPAQTSTYFPRFRTISYLGRFRFRYEMGCWYFASKLRQVDGDMNNDSILPCIPIVAYSQFIFHGISDYLLRDGARHRQWFPHLPIWTRAFLNAPAFNGVGRDLSLRKDVIRCRSD